MITGILERVLIHWLPVGAAGMYLTTISVFKAEAGKTSKTSKHCLDNPSQCPRRCLTLLLEVKEAK